MRAARAAENLARNRTYRLHPRPNYRYCTDPGDARQLTDGVYTKGYFWTQKTTVGWNNANPARITIDLGRVQPVGGVGYSTAAGVAGVTWPINLLVLTSEDGKTWYLAGDLTAMDESTAGPKADGYAQHRYHTRSLKARGRYVQLVVSAAGPYIFCDEIEIYRGADSLLKGPMPGERVSGAAGLFRRMAVEQCVRRRLRRDTEAVRKNIRQAKVPDKLRRELLAELAALEPQIKKVHFTAAEAETFRTVFPVSDLHRRIFAVQGKLWAEVYKGQGPLLVWPANRWDPLSPTDPPKPGKVTLSFHLMQGERRTAAFNVTNASGRPVTLGLDSSPFHTFSHGTERVQVHQILATDTKSGSPVFAAVVPSPPLPSRPPWRRSGPAEKWGMALLGGMTTQVWVAFHAGEYAVQSRHGVTVMWAPHRDSQPGQPSGERTFTVVPAECKVYPTRFPKQPSLHLGGWDYTDRDRCYNVTPANRDAFIKLLREYYVDTPWAQRSVMPYGTYDKTGRMIKPPEDARFRTWLKRWPGARNYFVFASVGSRFAQFAMGTPEFKRAVSAWIRWWVAWLKKQGVRADQLGLLLVDEPHSAEQDRVIIEYAKVIQAAEPDVVIWNDPTWREPWKATPELFTTADVLCPNLPMLLNGGKRFADFYVKQREAGRTLWFYSCSGPGKLLDPYAYHRMQAWFCWKHGAKGMGYWAFGDSNGASSWNEYLSVRGAYTPLFLDDKTVTLGKHMEAIREGVQDYEYLRMLRDAIDAKAKADPKCPHLPAARKLLAGAADRVTACMTDASMTMWHKPKDRSVADKVRIEILEMLVRLRSKKE